MTENNELTEEELNSLQEHRQELAQHITDSIEVLAQAADEAAQQGNDRAASKLRGRITTLERKREEVLSGKR